MQFEYIAFNLSGLDAKLSQNWIWYVKSCNSWDISIKPRVVRQ